ncbi:MAG: 5'-nucleotidase C-terminal domain-containing protein [Paracoccaceae bacterium]
MRRLILASAALAALAGPAAAEFALTLLHVNDLHSRLQPISDSDGACPPEADAAGACFGGVARLATLVATRRAAAEAEGRAVLLLDAGDQFQGSPLYTTYKGAAEAEFMEAIGFDAMAVGNHEFDDGPEGLAGFLDAVSFPVISGNIDVSASAPLAGRVAPHAVLEAGGERIGIVSALAVDTVETSSPGPDVVFSDEIESLTAAVAALEAEGVNKIVALTHVGLAKDIRIAGAVPGLDVIVGGHSHTWLSASDPDAAGAYPTVIDGPDGTPVPIVQAYAYGRFLGELHVVFDEAGEVVSFGGDTLPIDASVAPDPEIAARVDELAAPIEALENAVVAESVAPIDGDRADCRTGECEMGNLVADAMLARSRDRGVRIAIQNGGGLRASIDAGPVTMGEVLTVLPFRNALATFRLSGAGVLAALENGLSRVEDRAGRFPQVAGLRFVWDPRAEPGARVVSAEVATEDGWEPLDPEAVYGVATNDYMRGGGDGYAVFAERGTDADDDGPALEQVVADHLAEMGPYEPYTDGRISTR